MTGLAISRVVVADDFLICGRRWPALTGTLPAYD
jgi:hypothetical protein